MSTILQPRPQPKIVYPDTDGQPITENTVQFEYIVTIKGGLDAMYRDDNMVFVAGDLFWYPVEGEPSIRTAPDILLAFGRPKGDRGSYQQWLEANVAPQVVFEVLSPGNRHGEMYRKFEFFQRYGVEEYYLYDPDRGNLEGWIRRNDKLCEIETMVGWTSPRLKIRFELEGGKLQLFRPDGGRFLTYLELDASLTEIKARIAQLEEQLRARNGQPGT